MIVQATLVGSGANVTSSTITGNQQAGVINNYYGSQEKPDDNQANALLANEIQTHLRQFYQEHAAYILPLTGEGNEWPIVYTYRQLALVTAIESRILYVVKALDVVQLPDASALVSPAIVVTATGTAYFIERGDWVREAQSNRLIQIAGIVLPKGLEAIQENYPRRVSEQEGADRMIKQVMEKYASMGGREAVLRTYETRYEHYEKRQIALEHVWESREGEKHLQRILVTGRAGIGKSTLLQYIAYCWSLGGSQAVLEPIKPLWQEQYTWVIWLPLKLLHREECVEDDKKATSYQRIAYFIQKVCGLEQLEAAEDSDFTKSLAKLLRQHEARILLLVDSFDEVARWINTGCPRGQLLRALFAWKGPMMVTTRPYAQPQLPQTWKPDRWIENEGFLDADIEAFVRHYFECTPQAITDNKATNKATRLLRILRQNIGIWSLAHVPLMTRLLCLHWQQATAEEQALAEKSGEQLTLTGILQVFVEGFVRRSVKKMAKDQDIVLPEDDKLLPSVPLDAPDEQHDDWLAILAHLAFEGLRRGQNQILSLSLQENILRKVLSVPRDKKHTLLSDDRWKNQGGLLFQNVLKLGLLQPIGQAMPNPLDTQHTFLHLLFQEYLAAYYIARHLEKSKIQVWIRINRYLGQYQYVFAFVSGLVNDDAQKQQDYWELLQDSPSTLNGLAELELGLMCLPETRHRSALEDKVQPLFAASQCWLARLMDPEEVLLPHEVLWVTQRLLPLWQRLSIADGMRLLGKWQTQLMRWMQNTEDAEEVKQVIGLCQVLGPIGAPLMGWLPEGFIEAGIDRLTLEDWEKREQGLQVLIGLRQQLITQEDWVVALVRLILTGSPSSKLVSVTLLQQLDPDHLLNYGEFKKQVNACLEALDLQVQTWGWRLLRYLGRKALGDKSFWKGIEAAWWSWDLELHQQIEHDLRGFGYQMPEFAQLWYPVIQELQSDGMGTTEIQIITGWHQMPEIEQFQRGLQQALHSKRKVLVKAGLKGLAALWGLQGLDIDASKKIIGDSLVDDDGCIRIAALSTLGKLGIKALENKELFDGLKINLGTQKRLKTSLSNLDGFVRSAAFSTLGNLGIKILELPALCEGLKAGLSDRDRFVRCAALSTLGNLGIKVLALPELCEKLKAGLSDRDWFVRCAALSTLGNLGTKVLELPELCEGLKAGLSDQDKLVRSAALSTIGDLGVKVLELPELHDGLIASLEDADQDIKKLASLSLGQTWLEDSENSVLCELLQSTLFDSNMEIRKAALKVVEHLGIEVLQDSALFQNLSSGLVDSSWSMRAAALSALGHLSIEVLIEFPEWYEHLRAGLFHNHLLVQEAALSMLSHLNVEVWKLLEQRAVPRAGLIDGKERRQDAEVLDFSKWRKALEASLVDQNREIRRVALSVLGRLGTGILEDFKFWGMLEAELTVDVEDIEMRCTVLSVLGDLSMEVWQDAKFRQVLKDSLRDKDKWIRKEAWMILGNLGVRIMEYPDFHEILRDSLGSKDERIRSKALKFIGKLNVEKVMDLKVHQCLLSSLKDHNYAIRAVAWSVLRQLGAGVLQVPELRQGLLLGLASKDEGILSKALETVGHLGIQTLSIEECFQCLTSSSLAHKETNILKTALESLQTSLIHANCSVQQVALEVLQHLGRQLLEVQEWRKKLLASLEDNDPKVRKTGILVLAALGIKVLEFAELQQGLRTRLGDNDEKTKQVALQVLEYLGEEILRDPERDYDLLAGLEDIDQQTLKIESSVLVVLGNKVLEFMTSRQKLCASSVDNEKKTQQAATSVLSVVGALEFAEFRENLTHRLFSTDERIRSNAWRVLKQCVPQLLADQVLKVWLENNLKSLLNELLLGEASIVVLAFKSLTSLGSLVLEYELLRSYVEVVLQRWETESVVLAVLSLLSKFGPRCLDYPIMFDSVCYYLNSPSTEVRCAALNCLGAMGPKLLEVMTSNHLNQEVTKPSLMEQHTQEILLKIDLSLGDTILEAVPASQLLRAILEEEPQLNEKVHQVVKALSGTARIRLWRDWLQEIVSNPELQPASVREQFYLFLASLVEIPGCLAGVLFALKNEDMMHQHSSLLERLLTPQNLRVLLKEYQQVIDSHADSGLTVREYVDLIQWLLQRPRIRAVLEIDHIILYEETVYHTIALDAEKIRQLQPSNPPGSQADISIPDCQATLFASKLDLDPDPKEPPSRFAHLDCQLI